METNKDSLYTFIMDFKGGTYISQVMAENEVEACNLWGKTLNPNDIKGFGIKTKQSLLIELQNEKAIPIAKNKNIWIMGLLLSGHFTIVHIIKTEKG